MSQRATARFGARPTALAVVFILAVGGGAWLVTRPDGSSVEIDTGIDAILVDASLIDAPPDSAVDAPPDSPIDAAIDAAVFPDDWTMETIYGPESEVGINGADGVDVATIDGKLSLLTPWEQSAKVTVSTKAGAGVSTWSTIELGTVAAVEDAKWCDVDNDGNLDILAAGQGRRIRVWFGPAPYTLNFDIAAATNVTSWIQLACDQTNNRFWAGGRNIPAVIGYLAFPLNPRDANAWTWTPVGSIGWTMSIVLHDMDNDGDLDTVVSDRLFDSSNPNNLGARWLENPSWTNHTIHKFQNEAEPKFLHVVSRTLVYDLGSNANKNLSWSETHNGTSWLKAAITQPSGVGRVHDVEPCDLDGDTVNDLVFTYSNAEGALIGVGALMGPTFAVSSFVDIDKGVGEKYDDVRCFDGDGDGDVDIFTSEQNAGLGKVKFVNPRLHP